MTKLPSQFSFTHSSHIPDTVRTVTFNPASGNYDELWNGKVTEWSVKQVERFVNDPAPLWINVRDLASPKTFRPIHERLLDIAQDLSYADDENIAAGKFRLYELAGDLERGTAHVCNVPPTPTEKLLLLAGDQCHAVTIFPDGEVVLQDLSDDRTVNLKSINLAVQWFGLKGQLDALEEV